MYGKNPQEQLVRPPNNPYTRPGSYRLALTDSEHLGPTGGADSSGRRSAVLKGNMLMVFYGYLGPAFKTIRPMLFPHFLSPLFQR